MAIPQKIINFLEKSKIKFNILKHKTVYTAFDKSQTLRVPPKIVGKTIVLKKKNELILVLIPANKNLDLKKIKELLKEKKIDIASEKMIKNKIKGVKIGAVPPFGNLWKIKTLVDRLLKKEKEIIINSGDWNFSIKISPKQLEKLIPDLFWGNFSISKK